ncbi:MAG: cytochrome c biogenesis heme-transporting ATPase CcmA [Gammaproteobacteria bacterium]|nr:cytochrome c biogenesis heme-transporting ATPase CcmA [Gammaproteobacteria bacterium]
MSCAGNCLEALALDCVRGDRQLFRDLSLRVEPGEVVQVEGANGSGKTSLLRILCGLLRPVAGEVRWRGIDIRCQRAAYHRAMLYVGHAAGIKDDLDALENLGVARGLAGARADTSGDAALARVGLGRFAELPVRMLSAGQRRRAGLARLAMADARLWLLDEPFTALDTAGREIVGGLIAEHLRGGGLVVLTSHQPVTIEGTAVRRLALAA